MSPAHARPEDPSVPAAEPTMVAEAVRLLLAALVAGGWLTLDSASVQWIVTAVGLLASVVATMWTRRRTTPLAAPRTPEGTPLAPAPPQPPPGPPTAP